MNKRPTETVRIPSDTRGDDWGWRRSQEMHDRNASAIDTKDARQGKPDHQQMAPRNTRMKIRVFRPE